MGGARPAAGRDEGRGGEDVRPIGSVLAALLAALSITSAVVFGLADRRTFVPPPDAEAESFARMLAMGREDRALARLTEELRRTRTAEHLRAYASRIAGGTGGVSDVRGETDWIAGDRASATASCRGPAGERRLRLDLRREKGLWRVAGIDAPG